MWQLNFSLDFIKFIQMIEIPKQSPAEDIAEKDTMCRV